MKPYGEHDNLNIDDENIVGGLLGHGKKLKLEDSDDEISKSHDVCPPCDYGFFAIIMLKLQVQI